MAFIGTLCLILVLTALAAHLCRRIGIPGVVGQLLVGLIVGTGGLQWIHSDELIHIFSEIGVILLMFLAGLESDMALLRKYFKPGMLVAIFGVIFPLLLGTGGGFAFDVTKTEAFFLGVVLAATSVSISVEVLKELQAVNTKEGSTILGASVVDDILIVLVLSISLTFLGGNQGNDQSIGITLLQQGIYFVLIYLLVKWIAPYLMHLSERIYTTASVIIMSLVICLGMSYVADFVGLSSVIGAFFAGIAVGQTKVKEQVFINVESIGYAIFIPVFFVNIGLEVELSSVVTYFPFILAFVVIAVISKLFGGYLGSKMAGFSNNSAWMVGAGMISRGEMALIVLQIGSQGGLIPEQYFAPMVITILISTLVSPLILKYFAKKVLKHQV
ncbi:cation:proton antiporter [Enterococcus columbae]|uniref:Monovalent cation:proton antiporter-2 family protein n=1 Tax=Enterococcus columbae DSM 7374 = ATCC 51263 TaxID=1121865 RepID=S1MTX4_9ENTE|nr:cation:proton antiporter [Enterococcus columbae]EOT39603.1 monovalent cation:proton antiporter-2 family protein [Enterococcus columbae DSM 7374 = ATCC 51263]EOW80130.1 monovalent cation:proton antiporter-2 family protein [Enterococcus columbae DSM 7374 = ATCC 51263]OJG21725.1 monovalent cation:proton antiporter-2 family protein [Enterococcus columbae DSM 7374 = ATCC 51263]